ncbi:MAG: replication initiation protein [Rhodopila sp.]
MLRLFVASTLRAQKNLRAGNLKAHLVEIGSKLVLLDHRYVSFNPIMRRVIRIDLDQTFASWDALRQAIQAAGVPPPNLAVAEIEADGRVVHPHGYWLLAQAVCCSENGRQRPQRLFRAIQRGLVTALRSIGADPGGLSNSLTGKNPLSPFWSCQVMSAAPFNLTNGAGAQPGLAALADHVRPIFDRLTGAPPEAGDIDVAALLAQSNGLFNVLKHFTFSNVARFHLGGCEEDGFEDFANATVAYALSLPFSRLNEAALEKRARRQAQFAWDVFERQSDRPNRGRCRIACEGKTLREKQQIGALAVAAVKRQQTLDKLITAYQQLVDDGVVSWGSIPVNGALAEQAKVAVRTVQKHRTALRAVIQAGDARRCEDKTEILSPTNPEILSISPSDLDPQKLPPPGYDQVIKSPERSGHDNIPCPGLSLLTILSSAPVMKPDQAFAPSAPAPHLPLPKISPALAKLELFPRPSAVSNRLATQSPADDVGASPPLDETQLAEMQAMLTRMGFVVTRWRVLPDAGITILPQTHPDPVPVPAVDVVAPAVALPEQASPAHGPHPVKRTHREIVPGFLEAQAAKRQHPPPARTAAPAFGRQIHPGGLLDQSDNAGEPNPSG